jgi:hypothetical protein
MRFFEKKKSNVLKEIIFTETLVNIECRKQNLMVVEQ